MYWRLRIPLLLLVFGVTAGFYQKFPKMFLAYTNGLLTSALYIGLVAVIFIVLERTGINEKKIHFIWGILLVFVGYLCDSLESVSQ
ncbi:hypothetical protein [Heyndrickxia ginsengihumi]|uniref:hypothetical protein n=1 Tax=Heyndrickxia ginsengihumi TaxID=363870 RepID=UPI003D24EAA2